MGPEGRRPLLPGRRLAGAPNPGAGLPGQTCSDRGPDMAFRWSGSQARSPAPLPARAPTRGEGPAGLRPFPARPRGRLAAPGAAQPICRGQNAQAGPEREREGRRRESRRPASFFSGSVPRGSRVPRLRPKRRRAERKGRPQAAAGQAESGRGTPSRREEREGTRRAPTRLPGPPQSTPRSFRPGIAPRRGGRGMGAIPAAGCFAAVTLAAREEKGALPPAQSAELRAGDSGSPTALFLRRPCPPSPARRT